MKHEKRRHQDCRQKTDIKKQRKENKHCKRQVVNADLRPNRQHRRHIWTEGEDKRQFRQMEGGRKKMKEIDVMFGVRLVSRDIQFKESWHFDWWHFDWTTKTFLHT
jgi:hypothetical protein